MMAPREFIDEVRRRVSVLDYISSDVALTGCIPEGFGDWGELTQKGLFRHFRIWNNKAGSAAWRCPFCMYNHACAPASGNNTMFCGDEWKCEDCGACMGADRAGDVVYWFLLHLVALHGLDQAARMVSGLG